MLDVNRDVTQDVARSRHDTLREWLIVGEPWLQFEASDAQQRAPRLTRLSAAIHNHRFAEVPAQVTDADRDHASSTVARARSAKEPAFIMSNFE